MKFTILLVHPARPENVGFICRAMKTQGFSDLKIIGPEIDYFKTNARKTAYGSHDILSSISFFSSISTAIESLDFIIGTTAKQRVGRKDVVSSRSLKSLIAKKNGIVRSIGIVFGSEENGLSSEELSYCDVVSTIPLSLDYPSLNLSQSVLIYLYELSQIPFEEEEVISTDHILQGKLKSEVTLALQQLDMEGNPVLFRRLIDRLAFINEQDARLLLPLLKKFKNKK